MGSSIFAAISFFLLKNVLEVCESFELSSKEMITLLADDATNKFYRQYSSYFDVVIGRNTRVSRNEKEEKYKEVCHDIYEEGKIDVITNEYLGELGVEYIVSAKPLDSQEWDLYKRIEGYFIYEMSENN